ncbi:TraB/GumN family protein [Qipengyuania gelatinilytica]|uniref:TraB/GumN family protein n=1 Tax=Qipengyuania gelatinilytica TaxID=2867231 RepID=A0ABX9A2L6_9SPHN|nr:TraB/GumN family protein [Qipengyuania gelatinilytica]QZD95483.1 TraB/GumN family protein [Qipengyuania gelatinilytica]
MKNSPFVVALSAMLLVPMTSPAWAQDNSVIEAPQEQKSIRNAGIVTPYTLRKPDPVVQDYEPAPAIWLLEDEDTKIYMFGTIHVLPEGFKWRNGVFDRIVGEVDELVVETSDADSDAGMQTFFAELMADADTRTPTSQRLTPESGEKWLKLGQLAGIPQEQFDLTPPLLAMFGAGLEMMEAQGSEHEYGVETVLEAEFAAAGKPIGSIEDSLDVLRSLLAIDEDLLIKELEEDLAAWDGGSIDTLGVEEEESVEPAETIAPFQSEHDWAQGETSDLSDLGFGDSEFGLEVERVLLENRNAKWTVWLENRLDQPGSILLAVGAAHLAGDVSVQSMLSERGLEVKRIQ